MTARLYLIGDPVAHSLSPLLHGAMIAQTGADCTYEARRVRAAELPAFLTEAKAACAGFNVTMPLKEAIVPLLRTSLTINAAGISDSRSGVGDVYVGPLVLGWHGTQWDAVAAAGMWLDSGSTGHPASAGKGFKSTMLTGGLTYYFDTAKTLSGSALLRFERHGKTDSGLRHGNQVTMEWGLGKAFGPVQAGVVGYSQWQTSNDSGPGASLNKSSRHALGAAVVYPMAPGLALKGAVYKELRAEAGTGPQPKGSLVRLTLVKAF